MFSRFNESPSKNPDIKTPLVVSFTLGFIMHFSPLAAFWCKGSMNDSHYFGFTSKKEFSIAIFTTCYNAHCPAFTSFYRTGCINLMTTMTVPSTKPKNVYLTKSDFSGVSFTSQFWPKLLVDFFALIVDELQDNLLLSPSWLLWVHAELAILNPRNIKSESLSMTHAEIEVHSRYKFYGITESKYS